MKIFVFESVTGGGYVDKPFPPPSLCREGSAMLAALAEDFAALDGIAVWAMRDARLGGGKQPQGRWIRWETVATAETARQTFDSLVRQADWTVVIAPELEGELLAWCRQVEAAGGRLLGPPPALVALTSDKEATCRYLAAAGIPVPAGVVLEPGQPVPQDFVFPAVVKPCWGAGSQGVRLVRDAQAAEKAVARAGVCCRLEQLGRPACKCRRVVRSPGLPAPCAMYAAS